MKFPLAIVLILVLVLALGAGEPVAGPLLLELPARWWKDLLAYDPIEVASSLPQPMLVLHGGRDYQVTADDFALWQQAFGDSGRASLIQYPRLNHLFAAGEGIANPEEYAQTMPFDPQPVADIAEWVHAH